MQNAEIAILNLIAAILFLFLTGIAWSKGWKTLGALTLLCGALAFLIPQFDWVKGLSKSAVLANLAGRVKSIGESLDSFYTQIEEMKAESEIQQQKIIRSQEELSLTQKEVLTAQLGLNKQQKKLEDIENIIKNFANRKEVDIFPHVQNPKMIITKHSKKAATVYYELREVPYPKTVELKVYVYSQPDNSFYIYGNIIIFSWGDSLSLLEDKEKSSYVSYLADHSKKSEVLSLTERDGKVYAGNTRLPTIPELRSLPAQ